MNIRFWAKKPAAPTIPAALWFTRRQENENGSVSLLVRISAEGDWYHVYCTSRTLGIAELVRLQQLYESNELVRDVFAEMMAFREEN